MSVPVLLFHQQLNFYSFRKIKFSDSIRIDYETEKKTANYWRFRHEFFQQGRPDLLVHIKRTNGKGSAITATSNNEAKPPETAASSAIIPASSVLVAPEKSEMQTLKKRIDEMTKNMDALTEMVQKVSLQQHQQGESELPGMKRKKFPVEKQALLESPVPDGVLSVSAMMDLDDMPSMEGVDSLALIPPAPMPFEESRESSLDSNEFVDQLFAAFHEDDGLLVSIDGSASTWDERNTAPVDAIPAVISNRPDPELMQRLSDALELLPKETQGMIIDRLITAITSTDFLASVISSDPKKLAGSSKAPPKVEEQLPPQPTPLAAATFAALLQHYTNQLKESNSRRNGGSSSEAAQSSAKKQLQKTIPVIPVHA